MSVWIRRCLSFACLLAAWLVVRPAAAAAPLCDEHAASAVAPLPILDAPDQTLNVGQVDDGCSTWEDKDVSYKRGAPPPPLGPAVNSDAVPTDPYLSVPPLAVRLLASDESEGAPRSGVRLLVERPPRA